MRKQRVTQISVSAENEIGSQSGCYVIAMDFLDADIAERGAAQQAGKI